MAAAMQEPEPEPEVYPPETCLERVSMSANLNSSMLELEGDLDRAQCRVVAPHASHTRVATERVDARAESAAAAEAAAESARTKAAAQAEAMAQHAVKEAAARVRAHEAAAAAVEKQRAAEKQMWWLESEEVRLVAATAAAHAATEAARQRNVEVAGLDVFALRSVLRDEEALMQVNEQLLQTQQELAALEAAELAAEETQKAAHEAEVAAEAKLEKMLRARVAAVNRETATEKATARRHQRDESERLLVEAKVAEAERQAAEAMQMLQTAEEEAALTFHPYGQLDVEVGERLLLLERHDGPDEVGWWKVQKRVVMPVFGPCTKLRPVNEVRPVYVIGYVPCTKLCEITTIELAAEAVAQAEQAAEELGIDRTQIDSLERSVAIYVTAASLDAGKTDHDRRGHDEAEWLELTEDYKSFADASKAALAANRAAAKAKLEAAVRTLSGGHAVVQAGKGEGTHWEAAIKLCAEGLAVESTEQPSLTHALMQTSALATAGREARDFARSSAASRTRDGRASVRNGDAVLRSDCAHGTAQSPDPMKWLDGAGAGAGAYYTESIVSFVAALALDTQSESMTAELIEAVAATEFAIVEGEAARVDDGLARDLAIKMKAREEVEREAAAAAAAAVQEAADAEARAAELLAAAPPCAQPPDVRPFLPRQLCSWLCRPDVADALAEHRHPGTYDEFNGLHERRSGCVVFFDVWGLTKLIEALVMEGHKFPAHVSERSNQRLLKILRAVGVDVTAGQSFATGAEAAVALLEKVFGSIVELVLAAGGDVVRVSDEGLVAVFFDGDGAPFGSAAEGALRCAAATVIESKSLPARYLRMRVAMSSGWLDTMVLGGESFHYRYCVTGAPFFGIPWLLEAVEKGEVMIKEDSWEHVESIAKGTWCIAGEDGAYRIRAVDVAPPPIPPGPQALKQLLDYAEPVNRPLVGQLHRYFPEWREEVVDDPYKGLGAQTMWKFLPPPLAVEINAGTTTGLVRQVTTLHMLLHCVSTGLERDKADVSEEEELQQMQRGATLATQLQRAVGIVQNALHGRGYITGVYLYDDERGYVCTAAFDSMSCRRGDPTAAGVLAAMQIAEECGEGACSVGISTGLGFVGPSSVNEQRRSEYCVLGRGNRMAQFLSAVRERNGEVVCDTKTMEVVDGRVMDGRLIAEARTPIKDRSPDQCHQAAVPLYVLLPQKEALTIGLWAGRFSSRWEMAQARTVGREEIIGQLTARTSELAGTSGQAEKEVADAARTAAAAEAERQDVEEAELALAMYVEMAPDDVVAIKAAKEHLEQQKLEAKEAAETREREWREAEEVGAAEELALGEGSLMILAGREGAGKSHLLRIAENILEAGAEGAIQTAQLLHTADVTDPGVCCEEPLAAWRPVVHACLGLAEGDERIASINKACREWTGKHMEFSKTVEQTLVDLVQGDIKPPDNIIEEEAVVRLLVDVICTAASGGDFEDKQGLAVVIDDASRLDPLSWDVVIALGQRLEAAPSPRATYSSIPLLLLLAVEVNPLDGTLVCPSDLIDWPIVTVPPLSVDETTELMLAVNSDGAASVDRDLAEVVWQECLGLPRCILEWTSLQHEIGGVATDKADMQVKWKAKGPDGNHRRLVADLPASLSWEFMQAFARQSADWQLTLQLCATISTCVLGLKTDPKGRNGFCGDILVQTHTKRLSEPVLSQYMVDMERQGFLIRAVSESNHDPGLRLQDGEDPLVRLAPKLAAGQLPTETWSFRSEEIRQAVYHTLTTEERRNMHSSLVEHLEFGTGGIRDGMDHFDLPRDKWNAAAFDRRAFFVQLLEHAALSMDQSTVLRLLEKLPGGPGMVLSDDERDAIREELKWLKPIALRKRAIVEEIRGDLIKKAEDAEFPKDSLVELIVGHLVWSGAREEKRENAERDRLCADAIEEKRLFDEAVKAQARPAQLERRRQALVAAEVAMWTDQVAGDPDATNPAALAVRYFPVGEVLKALKTRHDDDMAPLAANWNDVHWAVGQWKAAGFAGERPKRSLGLSKSRGQQNQRPSSPGDARREKDLAEAEADTEEHIYGIAIDLRPSGRFDKVEMSFLTPPRPANVYEEGAPLLLPGSVPLLADRDEALQRKIESGSILVRSLTDAANRTLSFGAYESYPNAQSMALEQEALIARKMDLAAACEELEKQLRGRDDPVLDIIKPDGPPPEPEATTCSKPQLEPPPEPVKEIVVVERTFWQKLCWCCCRPTKEKQSGSGLSAAAAAYADDY